MRTHLLRTIYPMLAEASPETGFAANDACYDSTAHATTMRVAASIESSQHPSSQRTEEYELGGYAGI